MKKILVMFMVTMVAYVSLSFMDQPVEMDEIKVVAEAGDTVWDLAEKYYSEKDSRCFDEFVYTIRKENDLLGSKVLQAGQEIIIRVEKRK